jgi:hypothetical protein
VVVRSIRDAWCALPSACRLMCRRTGQQCWFSHLVQITWEVFAIPRFHRLPSCTSSTAETTPRKCRRAVHPADRPPPGEYLFSQCREPGESCKDLRAASTSSLPGPAPRMWLPCLPVMPVHQYFRNPIDRLPRSTQPLVPPYDILCPAHLLC